MTFAQRLAELLKNGNMTAYRLSKTLGVHQTTVKNWLDGNSKPRTEYIEKIAEHFGVSIDYLMGNSNDPIGGVVSINIMNTDVKNEDTMTRYIKRINKLANHDSDKTWKFLSVLCRNERIERDLTERYVSQNSSILLQNYLNFEKDCSTLPPQSVINIMETLGIDPDRALGYLEGDMIANMKDKHERAAFIEDNNTEAGKILKNIMVEIPELDIDTLNKIADKIKEIKISRGKNEIDDSAKFHKIMTELRANEKSPQNEPGADS